MRHQELTRFVSESNRIEGIDRSPTSAELDAHEKFLLSNAAISDLRDFVSIVAPGHVLRIARGADVRIGAHRPPVGGPEILIKLNRILDQMDVLSPHRIHCLYEDLHPFTDGNGRSGRVLWLWMTNKAPEHTRRAAKQLGFLHCFYYQTLSASGARNPARMGSGVSLTGNHRKFPCECGGEFGSVVDTRPQPDGTIKRYRKCADCQRRIPTIESVACGAKLNQNIRTAQSPEGWKSDLTDRQLSAYRTASGDRQYWLFDFYLAGFKAGLWEHHSAESRQRKSHEHRKAA